MVSLKEKLRAGKKRIGIWGLGYIGFSSMAHFARAGVTCIGTDLHKQRVEDVNKGKATIPNLDFWLGFDTVQLAKGKLMAATTAWEPLIAEDIAVHLIAVPTERDGNPHHEILKDVIEKICQIKKFSFEEPPLIVIESTITPNAVDKVVIPLIERHGLKVGKHVLVGIAPRRDWFTSPDKGIKNLPRVVGGTDNATTDLMQDVFSLICDTVLKAKDHKHAAIVKSVENAYRQVEITLANQLSNAYPTLDMTSILKLVGTKWNIETFHPSFGTGGYACDEKTEILTFNGWKRYDELNRGQKVLTFNTTNNLLEYKPIKDIFVEKYNGKMIKFSGQSVDMLLHPNHRVLLRKNNKSGYYFESAGNLPEVLRIPVGRKLRANENKYEISKNFAKVLGWVYSEASLFHPKSKKSPVFIIGQSTYCKELEDDLKAAKIKHGKNLIFKKGYVNRSGIRINRDFYKYRLSVEDTKKILQYIDLDKKFRRNVMRLSTENKRHILQTIIMGDGNYGCGRKDKIYQRNEKDELQELIILTGYRSNLCKKDVVSVIKKSHTMYLLKSKNTSEVDYKGKIWCIAVENGTFMARRNGKTFLTGNCIPLAPQYVLEGAENPEALTLLHASLETDFSQPEKVVESLVKRGAKKVAILGIAYTADLKVHILSPAITIAKKLREKGIEVKAHDPYYSPDEIKQILGAEKFEFPQGLKDFDAVLIVANHMLYRYTNEDRIMQNLGGCKLILDNMGIWKDFKFPECVEYHEAGDSNWLKAPEKEKAKAAHDATPKEPGIGKAKAGDA